MEQVLSAVGYAHKQSVIHRDLKPSNVMVMANGDAKVTDFGIAKVLGSTKLTRTGTAMGSAHYMSPEQIRRPEAVDARSDIYSLGCVFYEVLTGRPPFGEKDAAGTESDFEIKIAHTNEVAPGLSEFNKNIPVWLDHLVMSMLEKEPDQRPSNCEEILSQIRQGGEPLTTEKKNKTVVIKDKPVYSDEVKSTNAPTSGRKVSNQLSLSLIFSIFGIGFIALAWFFLYPTKKNSLPQLKSGAEVYKTVCAACHDTGAANAPKIGDFAAWSERLTKGYDTLLSHTINGFYAMPAKGGLPELHDIEVARAVVYLANASGAHFNELQGSK
jgi:serine/threonine protein kinase